MEGKTINTVCRLCIGLNVQLHHVFESEIVPGCTASDAIWELLRIQVSESDVYPKFICAECIKKLVDFKLFKHQCELNKETLDQEYTKDSEIGANEDAVGMVLCGNENHNELFLKEEDVEVPIEKDPLDLSEEVKQVKSEVRDTSNDYNDVPSAEVIGSADHVSVKIECESEDQLRAEDCDEFNMKPYITSTEAMASKEENPVSGWLPSTTLGSEKIYRDEEEPREHWRSNWDTGTDSVNVNVGPRNTTDLLFQRNVVGGNEDDPGLNSISTCKEEMSVNYGTEESAFEEISSFRGENTVWITSDSSTMGQRREDSSTNVEDVSVNIHKIHDRFHASTCDDGAALISQLDNSNVPKNNPIAYDEVNARQCVEIYSRQNPWEGYKSMVCRDRPFKCNICSKAYVSKSHLKRHAKIHSASKRFQCKQCNKTFVENGGLVMHMTTHTGERPFKCDQCGRAFSQKANARAHMLTHTGERRHQCDICRMKFARQTTLRKHMITHTGEKRHQCEVCDKRFSQKFNVKIHMRTHLGDIPLHMMTHVGK